MKKKNELYHYGIKGQKWGERNYQYADGTLTPAGRKRYSSNFKIKLKSSSLSSKGSSMNNHGKYSEVSGSIAKDDLEADKKNTEELPDNWQDEYIKELMDSYKKYYSKDAMKYRGETKKPSFTEFAKEEFNDAGFIYSLGQNTGYELENMKYTKAQINKMEQSIKKRLGIYHSDISTELSIDEYAEHGSNIVSKILNK